MIHAAFRRPIGVPLAVLPFLALVDSDACAQGTINTDRPGFTYSPSTVPEGRTQIEVGAPNVLLVRGQGSDVAAWSSPFTLRHGLTTRAELRLSGSGWNRLRDESGSSSSTQEGFGDLAVGLKFALTEAKGWSPTSAIVAHVRLPVGEDAFSTHQPAYDATLAADWDLGSGNLLRGIAGIASTPTGSDDAITGSLGALFGRTFCERWSGYVEAGYFPGFDHARDQAVVGTGIAYLLSNDLQLDAAADFGLDETAPDANLTLGLSWRF
jgi:hypothetical protein